MLYKLCALAKAQKQAGYHCNCSDFIAIVKFFPYRTAIYLGITKISPILARILILALDGNHFTYTFLDFAKTGYFTR